MALIRRRFACWTTPPPRSGSKRPLAGAQALAAAKISAATEALRDGGVHSPELEALARYVLDRTH